MHARRLAYVVAALGAGAAFVAGQFADASTATSGVLATIAALASILAAEIGLRYRQPPGEASHPARLALDLPPGRSPDQFYQRVRELLAEHVRARAGVFLAPVDDTERQWIVEARFGPTANQAPTVGILPADIDPRASSPIGMKLRSDDPWFGWAAGADGLESVAYARAIARGEAVPLLIVVAGRLRDLRPRMAMLQEIAELAGADVEAHAALQSEHERSARLQELDNVRSDFLARVAHELKTPLTSVRGAFDLLSEELGRGGRPEIGRMIDAIGRGIERLASLTNDLIEFERLRQAQLPIHTEPIQLHGVVQAAVSLVSPLIIAREQSLVVEVPPDGLLVEADRRRLEEVVTNLLMNANAYAGEAGSIRVRAWRNGDAATIEVSDSGPGIIEAELDAIFEPFYRGDRSPLVEGGSGLGLAIARSLVELHGGRIWAESTPGSGARFYVSLPTVRESRPRRPRSRAATE